MNNFKSYGHTVGHWNKVKEGRNTRSRNLDAITDPYTYVTRSRVLKTSRDQVREAQIALEL